MSTFNSHTFRELAAGNFSADGPDVTLQHTTYHVPGGSTNVRVSVGVGASTFELLADVTAAQLAALQGDVDGSNHTLSWSQGSVSVGLIGVLKPKRLAKNADLYRCVLRCEKL